jgi:hypothetical protein
VESKLKAEIKKNEEVVSSKAFFVSFIGLWPRRVGGTPF